MEVINGRTVIQIQTGYKTTLTKMRGFVLTEGDTIIGYSALLINDEPAYEKLEGQWLAEIMSCFIESLFQSHLGKGLATKIVGFIETFALSNNIYSVRDTNFDNFAMMAIF
jgi:hypothetical protein